MKTCRVCQREQPMGNFQYGRSECNECRAAYMREYGRKRRLREGSAVHNRRLSTRYGQAKYFASKRGITFSLTFDEYCANIDTRCHYCGNGCDFYGVGLDRKDNSQGYTVANVVPCCGVCNIVKGARFTYDEMLVVGKAIAKVKASRRRQ